MGVTQPGYLWKERRRISRGIKRLSKLYLALSGLSGRVGVQLWLFSRVWPVFGSGLLVDGECDIKEKQSIKTH